jgi:hypothetical protein
MADHLTPIDKISFDTLMTAASENDEHIEITDREITFELNISKPTQRHAHVLAPRTTMQPVRFTNCQFDEKVSIEDLTLDGQIIFNNCVFLKEVRIASLDDVTLQDMNRFEHNIYVKTGVEKVAIEQINFKRFLFISGHGNLKLGQINEGIEPLQGDIELKHNFAIVVADSVRAVSLGTHYRGSLHELQINKCKFTRLDMLNSSFGNCCRISESVLGQFLLYEPQRPHTVLEIKSGTRISKFVFHLASFETLLCQNAHFEQFELFGSNMADSTVKLEIVTIQGLTFRDLRNRGHMAFHQVDISAGGSLTMKASDLGKTDFILCEFGRGSFEFQNAKLLDAFMAETNFPRHITSANGQNCKQEQLAFGQISTAYQKQGDTVRTLEYQAREIEAHYKDLRWFAAGPRSFSFTKFSLWLNKWSNDFGRNWGRGLLFSFGLGLILYYLLVISSDQFHIGWPSIDGRLVSAFFKFMNPLRFFETENLFKTGDDKPYLTLHPVSYFVDFFARILVAYGYYQTIQAFRRYGRKS